MKILRFPSLPNPASLLSAKKLGSGAVAGTILTAGLAKHYWNSVRLKSTLEDNRELRNYNHSLREELRETKGAKTRVLANYTQLEVDYLHLEEELQLTQSQLTKAQGKLASTKVAAVPPKAAKAKTTSSASKVAPKAIAPKRKKASKNPVEPNAAKVETEGRGADLTLEP